MKKFMVFLLLVAVILAGVSEAFAAAKEGKKKKKKQESSSSSGGAGAGVVPAPKTGYGSLKAMNMDATGECDLLSYEGKSGMVIGQLMAIDKINSVIIVKVESQDVLKAEINGKDLRITATEKDVETSKAGQKIQVDVKDNKIKITPFKD
ncbi:MAG: hypothetical protein NTX32_05075 [Candidatus Firestonebacteria bacterium]|nr:hypothetical protein [Candidatus Firestonebacteria bacterium]